MGLLDSEDLRRRRLCKPPALNDANDLKHEFGFQLFAFRVWKAEVPKYVSTTPLHADSGLLPHLNSAFLCSLVPLPQDADRSGRFPSEAWRCPSLTSSGRHVKHRSSRGSA